ncbi:uncharacterized protein FOMMEDRAFT_138756 [Fomitiporia mediterranea MF3/22]|uniref:uncharacterized protein n=1 Tax=Fomitiporia mediterranea (strain MF3/22) TaxID=694068 RepID=UPI00044098AA|nr:uncharacterized protein FOMMEDRAFT_138756 [Fomitiporia mediterranea MF3/22]EJD07064.1 hypothetical protein FOMMEDRAFT_138756 [Fomitiporia mediterranea MF3/22]
MSAPMNIQHRRTPSATIFAAPQPSHAHARSLSGQFGTSWSDAFDFTSCSPLNSELHLGATSPPMSTAYLPSSFSSSSSLGLSTSTSMCASMSMSCSPRADYFTFERNYCSNFACCGITLPDMHALVAHFEETHINTPDAAVPFAANCGVGQRVGVAVPQSKPVPQINVNTTFGMNLRPGTASSDAPSPHSSVGPETPPPASHVPAYGFPSQPQLQVQTHMYASSRANTASPYPHSPFSSNSPYAASPLSAGSPASSGGAEHSDASGSNSGSTEELGMDIDVDVLMHFDPLDGGAHTPLDSTPPSPLAHPIRPASVLRAAALKNNGTPDAPPVGFPPSLFTAPAPSLERDASRNSSKKEKKEKRSRPDSPVLEESGSSSSGGAVRREKARKTISPMNSLLGATVSRTSSISSHDASPSSEEGDKETCTQEEKVEREVRTGRPERVERNEKGGKKVREKAYKCPKPGCTKSYLNPNGLKYHTLKGTCTFADGSTAPPTPVTPTTPSVPSVPSLPLTASNSPILSKAPVTSSTTMTSPTSPLAHAYRHQTGMPVIAPPAAPSMMMYAPGVSQVC